MTRASETAESSQVVEGVEVEQSQQFWTSRKDGTSARHRQHRIGPVRLGYSLYLHRYPRGDKRLVIQPYAFFDFGSRNA